MAEGDDASSVVMGIRGMLGICPPGLVVGTAMLAEG